MQKTKRMLQENLAIIDIVVELLDARIPYSSKNPDIDQLAAHKKRILILNKADLADTSANMLWKQHYEKKGFVVVEANAINGKGLLEVATAANALMQEKILRNKQRGRLFVPTRAMILGIPNVGKSTLINNYAGKQVAKTADKPGVTRGKQWIKVRKDFELLDTPGILWPKFDDKKVGLNLAFTGAINDNILDSVTLATELLAVILPISPQFVADRYNIQIEPIDTPHQVLQKICEARFFKLKGGEPHLERGAITLLDEFRGGKLGRITLELPTGLL